MNEYTLAIDNLAFGYGDKPLIKIEKMRIRARERVAIIGPSGCGKTTFIHLVAGLIRPQSGSIRILSREITKLKEWEVDRIRGREIGIVFQRLYLMPSISILDNLLLAQRLARANIDSDLAMQLLERLGIAEFSSALPHKLSQGQAQRAAIARAIVHKPALVIGDEPTSALDDGNTREAIQLLTELSETVGFSLMIVTHDERVRDEMDRVIRLGVIS
ncbi:MAG: putative ABC transport system ATP-binding protein [Candidatus Azotimanducaceae bacterium]|jgi:putative ABC transport system ATP-binding protein